MSSWHEDGARRAFLECLRLEGAAKVYAEVELGRQVQWCRGADCAHAVERAIVGQTHTDEEHLEQLWVRGRLEAMLQAGVLRRIAIPVGSGPLADRFRAENQAALSRALADYDLDPKVNLGHGATDDGTIAWSQPLELFSKEEAESRGHGIMLQPGAAPLEIGYTLPSRTYAHLFTAGAVWRWPYGSARLWLLGHGAPLNGSALDELLAWSIEDPGSSRATVEDTHVTGLR